MSAFSETRFNLTVRISQKFPGVYAPNPLDLSVHTTENSETCHQNSLKPPLPSV